MFTVISENKGFYKIEENGIKYNVSEKKFDQLKAKGKIIGEQEIQQATTETAEKLDLSALKKDGLIELAARLGMPGDLKDAKKSELIDFISKQ
jgi:hypothetical protein